MNHRFKIIQVCFWVITVALLTSYTNAQSRQIKGSIIDKSSKEPISFAAIGVVGDTKGTLSNENGAFQLSIQSLPIQLKISCLGYKTTQVEVTNESELVVKLEQVAILLPEATVSLLGSKLMNAVYEKAISDKYEYTTKGFYRQTTKGNGETTEFLEFYSDFLMNPADNIIRYDIQNGRYGYVKRDSSSLTFRIFNFKTLVFGVPVAKKKLKKGTVVIPLIPKLDEYYKFIVEGSYLDEDNEIVKVRCVPKETYTTFFEGHYFVNKTTQNIVKFDGELKGYTGLSFQNEQIRNINKSVRIIAGFQEIGTQSVVQYIHASTSSELTHFPTNRTAQFETKGTLYFYDYFTNESFRGKKVSLKTDDLKEVKNAPYSPEFWKKNNPIKYTIDEDEAIKVYDKNNYFGTYFENE